MLGSLAEKDIIEISDLDSSGSPLDPINGLTFSFPEKFHMIVVENIFMFLPLTLLIASIYVVPLAFLKWEPNHARWAAY